MDSDRSSTDGANAAASHNGLSGKARLVAQAHAVFGDVHMYDTSSPKEARESRTRVLMTDFLALVAIVLSMISLLLSMRRAELSGSANSATATNHLPQRSKQSVENTPKIAELAIPPGREGGRQDYLLEIPEIASVYSFQAYRCHGRMYHQVLVGALQTAKRASGIVSVARTYGDNFAAAAWRSDAFSRYLPPQSTSRSSYGGDVTYPGVELFGTMPLTADARCGIDAVIIGVLALDHDDTYSVFVVLVGASYHSPDGERQAERDARFILNSIVIDFEH